MRLASSLVVALALAACGGSTFTSSAPGSDASAGDDATTGDAATDDASSGDGGTRDTGTMTDARADAPTGDGGLGLDGGVGSCSGSSTIFNDVTKGCTVSAGCIVVEHQVDCCGSIVAVGINHASKDAFDADEKMWRASCPGCGCPARPTTAEDGKQVVDPGVVSATCTMGVCRSYVP
jgi:hypothetical protein